jgi:hypothetical protein
MRAERRLAIASIDARLRYIIMVRSDAAGHADRTVARASVPLPAGHIQVTAAV